MNALLPLLLQVVATAAPAQAGRDVVVTGPSLNATARALAECLARHCSPREDIAATLAHAENQFVAGDYPAARRTLLAGRGRNARHAKQLPVEVADLSRANARLAGLNGFKQEALTGEIETLDLTADPLRSHPEMPRGVYSAVRPSGPAAATPPRVVSS